MEQRVPSDTRRGLRHVGANPLEIGEVDSEYLRIFEDDRDVAGPFLLEMMKDDVEEIEKTFTVIVRGASPGRRGVREVPDAPGDSRQAPPPAEILRQAPPRAAV